MEYESENAKFKFCESEKKKEEDKIARKYHLGSIWFLNPLYKCK